MSVEVFKKIKDEAKYIKGQPVAIQIRLFTNIVTVLDTILKAPDRRNRKTVENLRNSAQSFIEGLRSGEAEQSDILDFVDESVKAYDQALSDRDGEDARRKTSPGVSVEDDEGPGQQAIPVPGEKPVIRHDTGDIINKYDKFQSKVPKRLSKGWTTIRVPIVVMTQPSLNMDALRRQRLATDSISWYTVLTEQVLVGLDHDWMVSLVPDKKSSKKQAQPITGNPNLKMQPIVQTAMEEIMRTIKERWGHACLVMGRPVRRDNVLWVWIATTRMANQLNRCSPSQHFIVSDWGFPFKSEVVHWKKSAHAATEPKNLTTVGALKRVQVKQEAETAKVVKKSLVGMTKMKIKDKAAA